MPATSQWIASIGETVRPMLGDLHVLSRIGLAQMYIPADQQFAYTIRGHRSAVGPRLTRSGQSVRYSAICALGIAAGGSDLPVASILW